MSKHHAQQGQNEDAALGTDQNVSGGDGQPADLAGDAAENSAVEIQETGAAQGQAEAKNYDSGEVSGTTQAAIDGGQNNMDGAESAQNTVKEPTPEEKIAGLEDQLAEIRDQLLRKAADFENFRKRMNQEKQNAIDFANQSLLLDIIPIIDDFERAIQSAESSKDFTDLTAGRALLDGITMIEKRLISQLESKWGLKRFVSTGEAFDPNRHEALMMEKSPDVSEPLVQEDLIKGYTLKDRVIRAAKVKVLMPETPAQTAENNT
jgi:molecular chaperone GrpE